MQSSDWLSFLCGLEASSTRRLECPAPSIAYLGRSSFESDMAALRADLGLSAGEAKIKSFDLPAGMMLEVASCDGSLSIMTSGDT